MDKYLWLEEVMGQKAIDWAKNESDKTIKNLSSYKDFKKIEDKAKQIYSNKEKIPYVWMQKEYVYNLWSDNTNIQGLFRRALIAQYCGENCQWETLLDLDLLSKKDNIQWVLHGFELREDGKRALIILSPGGSDANIVKEFDMDSKTFVEDGFDLPESKGGAHWIDNDTIWMARIFEESSKTKSGYANSVRELKRSQKDNLDQAKTIFKIQENDNSTNSWTIKDSINKKTYHLLNRNIDFYHAKYFFYTDEGQLSPLQIPDMTDIYNIVEGRLIFFLKQDWLEFCMGDILSIELSSNKTQLIYRPKANESVSTIAGCKDGFYTIIEEDIKAALYLFTYKELDNSWQQQKIDLPTNGSLNSLSTNNESNDFFVSYSSYNQPATYYYGNGGEIKKIIKVSPSFFTHEEIRVQQKFVKSTDGVMVPYFLVHKSDLNYNGLNPTILYGYGGFEITLSPNFNNALGSSWLEKGGVYVVANIRGGGEYGPKWHQSALKEKRQIAYDDFFAVAQDLIDLKITSKEHLGAWGGSNGGLLMGVCYTQRPDLFKAINCAVPLLDMKRYHKLLAGASWIAEYGDPDDEQDGAFIRALSPYHNVKKDVTNYPVMFLNTSTKDDRVHPGHARKFCALLNEYNHTVYYYENMVGGHGGATNFEQVAFKHALDMSFFWSMLS